MPDDNGTEATRSDAPSADDGLFGDAAEPTAGPVADEQDANKETATGRPGLRRRRGAGRRRGDRLLGGPQGGRVHQGRQGHYRRAATLLGPAHRDLRRPGPVRAGAGGPVGGREGESQVGGDAETSRLREARSTGQASHPTPAGFGTGFDRRGRDRPTATRDAEAVLRAGPCKQGPVGMTGQVAVRTGGGHLSSRATACVAVLAFVWAATTITTRPRGRRSRCSPGRSS